MKWEDSVLFQLWVLITDTSIQFCICFSICRKRRKHLRNKVKLFLSLKSFLPSQKRDHSAPVSWPQTPMSLLCPVWPPAERLRAISQVSRSLSWGPASLPAILRGRRMQPTSEDSFKISLLHTRAASCPPSCPTTRFYSLRHCHLQTLIDTYIESKMSRSQFARPPVNTP